MKRSRFAEEQIALRPTLFPVFRMKERNKVGRRRRLQLLDIQEFPRLENLHQSRSHPDLPAFSSRKLNKSRSQHVERPLRQAAEQQSSA
ncbi:hypothetical protein N7373_03445 [Achromobacter mucicolens]|uniref:hypothetical protein n=1 Tax=Achromobacter mucicolens TaxID=1389922 RepID=UPI0024478A73|nr:hypothetical protein [Achromobacter mucicolens]MDH0090491.1 hypothetical protein [Achromobacter mucicolens]